MNKPMVILGVSAFYHDAAAAIVIDGKVVAAAQEERFSRKKHDASFPVQAIKYCLDDTGKTIDDLDAVVFYDKPFLKFERLLETYYAFAPKGIGSFIKAIPVWVKDKLFIRKQIRDGLKEVEDFRKEKLNLLFTEHHLSHAASAFYPSSFAEAAILTMDGVGEWATTSIGKGDKNKIEVLKEIHFPHSLGLLYSTFTYFLGFRVNSGEYKLMGLAPYGNPDDEQVKHFIDIIKEKLVQIFPDGSFRLNMKYFDFPVGSRMIRDAKWEALFGIKRRESESSLNQEHCNLAIAIQKVTEEIVLLLAHEVKRVSGCENLCLAGGVALNCVANGKLVEEKIFKNIFIQPAAGDAGGALGAALAAYHMYYDKERLKINVRDLMKGSFLGPDFCRKEIETVAKKFKANYSYFEDYESLCKEVARKISNGKIVGWMRGKMEFGPRALGARSILADPRSPEMQKKLNVNIKYRESFRPFAPAVMKEKVTEYFQCNTDSPYMLLVHKVSDEITKAMPPEYEGLPGIEKLYYQRSTLPAVTHIDLSARIQTVDKENNPAFWQLLNTFYQVTDCPVLINTSFNVRGEPIVCSPEDAYRCFIHTEMDYLVIENYLFDKRDQPETEAKEKVVDFVLD